MDDKSLKPPEPELIRVDLAKSCCLLLTHEEYKRGISRGKTERRRLANEARLAKIIAEKATISFPYEPGSP